MMNHFSVIMILGLMLSGCSKAAQSQSTQSPPPPILLPSPTPGISPEALAYLTEFFDIVRIHALNREKINIDYLMEQSLEREKDAVTSADTYGSIIYTLGQLKDFHSRFMTPEEVDFYRNLDTEDMENPEPLGEVRDNLAYLHIPQFASFDTRVNQDYANQLFDLVMGLDAQSPCGWVIDLRDNYGGNLAPMVSGLIPLIGDGIIGGFQDVEGNLTPIEFAAGEYVGKDENDWFDTGYTNISLQQPDPPIAILIGPRTTSSGEMLALTFKGRDNVAYFGHQTTGQTTGNDKFDLSDGAVLLLTTAIFVDREGTVYGGSVQPDFPLEFVSGYPMEIPPEVIEWMGIQAGCQVKE